MRRFRGLMLSGCVAAAAVLAVSPGIGYGTGNNNGHGNGHKPPNNRPPPRPPVSINSTSANRAKLPSSPVGEQPSQSGRGFVITGVNDLGMHCGDLDTRIASILPPYNVLHAQVIEKGRAPEILGPDAVDVYFSASSSKYDIVFDFANNPQPDGFDVAGPCNGVNADGSPNCTNDFSGVYKTNWWDLPGDPPFSRGNPGGALNQGAYNPFYPFDIVPPYIPYDVGLIVPDPAYLPDLVTGQQAMPGVKRPYQRNDLQEFARFDTDFQFFIDFGAFGYEQTRLNWFSADGIPVTTFDDFGRVNPYPLMRLSAVEKKSHKVIATVDTVAPVSGEANCKNCHTSNDPSNGGVGAPTYPTTTSTVNPIGLNNSSMDRAVSNAWQDPQYGDLPLAVSVEYSQDLNILRFHDRSNGSNYVDSAGNSVACVTDPNAPPDVVTNCLTYKALHGEPVVCQRCHYTPALDLAQVGPLGGAAAYPDNGVAGCPPNLDPVNCVANGRTQRVQPTMSRVIHRLAHGGTGTSGGSTRFTEFNMPPPLDPLRDALVTADPIMPGDTMARGGACAYDATTQTLKWPGYTSATPSTANTFGQYECTQCANEGKTVAECAVEATCYQCHPGKTTKCLRGAMASADMFCQDCHGSMANVGNDFSAGFSKETPFGSQEADDAGAGLRIPWATEPGCQSCHVGDAINQPADTTGFIYDEEGIRLLQAWRAGDPDAKPIASVNSRFAEDQTPLEHGEEPGSTKRVLFRLSRGQRLVQGDTTGQSFFTGHNGVFCQGCHGPTHAEWPVSPDAPNDGAWPPPKGSFVANDNVTAGQLQGHTGKLIECTACHSGDFSLQNGLGGPHGLHPVGGTDPVNDPGYSQWWVDNHGHYLNGRVSEDKYLSNCGVCHGDVNANTRPTSCGTSSPSGCGEGSPLAEMAQTRSLAYFSAPTGKVFPAGQKVICGNCHGGVPLDQ